MSDLPSGTPTRATDPTLPLTVIFDPIRDDCPYTHWLVPGDWTRGKAVAHVAEADGIRFTALRAYRVYLRWSHHDFLSAGWRFEDGTLVACERTDPAAERYWAVVEAPDAPQQEATDV